MGFVQESPKATSVQSSSGTSSPAGSQKRKQTRCRAPVGLSQQEIKVWRRRRASSRELRRIHELRDAFTALRKTVPRGKDEDKPSKLQVLVMASNYINLMSELLNGETQCQVSVSDDQQQDSCSECESPATSPPSAASSTASVDDDCSSASGEASPVPRTTANPFTPSCSSAGNQSTNTGVFWQNSVESDCSSTASSEESRSPAACRLPRSPATVTSSAGTASPKAAFDMSAMQAAAWREGSANAWYTDGSSSDESLSPPLTADMMQRSQHSWTPDAVRMASELDQACSLMTPHGQGSHRQQFVQHPMAAAWSAGHHHIMQPAAQHGIPREMAMNTATSSFPALSADAFPWQPFSEEISPIDKMRLNSEVRIHCNNQSYMYIFFSPLH